MSVFVELTDLSDISELGGYVPDFPDGFEWYCVFASPDDATDDDLHGMVSVFSVSAPREHCREGWVDFEGKYEYDYSAPATLLSLFDSTMVFNRTQFKTA